MTDANEAKLRRKAARRADAKLAFRAHLIAYVVINGFLLIINMLTSPGSWWVIWPMLGWGVGLVAHGVTAYSRASDAREDMIEAELARLKARQR